MVGKLVIANMPNFKIFMVSASCNPSILRNYIKNISPDRFKNFNY
jgi:hypothetical protein